MNAKVRKQDGLTVRTFEGYDVPDEYEQLMNYDNQTTIQNDYRRTLYWNPDVKLDNYGQAKVKFTTNSTCHYITATAEGFTNDGHPMTSCATKH